MIIDWPTKKCPRCRQDTAVDRNGLISRHINTSTGEVCGISTDSVGTKTIGGREYLVQSGDQ